jgi:hypothetical protein
MTPTALSPPGARAAAARAANDQLTAALVTLTSRGLRTPCSQPETHHYWLSEFETERALAAQWCQGCPVLDPCFAAAEAHGERWYVWGRGRHDPPATNA